MTQQQQSDLEFSQKLGRAIELLHLHDMMTDVERRKIERRYIKWAKKNGITVRKQSFADFLNGTTREC